MGKKVPGGFGSVSDQGAFAARIGSEPTNPYPYGSAAFREWDGGYYTPPVVTAPRETHYIPRVNRTDLPAQHY